jgi:hypothetical protein
MDTAAADTALVKRFMMTSSKWKQRLRIWHRSRDREATERGEFVSPCHDAREATAHEIRCFIVM